MPATAYPQEWLRILEWLAAEYYPTKFYPVGRRKSFAYQSQTPEDRMLYRGDRTITWFVSAHAGAGPTATEQQVDGMIAAGLLEPYWPDTPKVGKDVLRITAKGRAAIAEARKELR